MAFLSNPDFKKAENGAISFLDAHFQTVDQLQLDGLLQQVHHQHEELQANLSVSQREIETLVLNTRAEAETHLEFAQELSLQRHDIVDSLMELSQQLVSDMTLEERQPTLLEDIETLHRNLKELTSIKSYAQVIEYALSLSESALKQVQSCTTPLSLISISEYCKLQAFVSKVREFCQKSCDISSEQQPLHLVMFVESLESKTWTNIKTVLFNVLLATAETFGWPMPVNYVNVSTNERAVFENAFRNLLELQKLADKIGVTNEDDGLYPLQALVQPIFLRFKYHFEGSRQTNRLDKPEWYFIHVQNLAHDHRPFMEKVIQALLSSTAYASIDAWREFVLLLLSMLVHKMKRTIPSLLPYPPLLAHTIYQALVFDTAMRKEGFELGRTLGRETKKESIESETWFGISEVILGNEEWFNAWLEGEKTFADEQFHDIISSSDAWVIVDDDDGVDSQDYKPTISARRLKALIEQITDRYSPLPHTVQRARFLTTVQLPILDLYNRRIISSLDAYETLSLAFVRAVPGALTASFGDKDQKGININTRRLTAGVDGVQRLCKAFLSAAFLESALEGWSEELFFLDLWTQMNLDPAIQIPVDKSSLLPKVAFDEDTVPTNTVFDNLISRYTDVIMRVEEMIVQQVCIEVESHLKAHIAVLTADDTEQADDMAVSQTLLVPIALLSSHLTFIRSTLPQTALITLYRRIASRLAEHVLQRQILHRGQLSLAQAKVVAAECELWAETCHVALAGRLSSGHYSVKSPWLRLLQVSKLVSLEGDEWLVVRNSIQRDIADEEWAQLMTRLVGMSELDKGEVATVIQRREDF